LRFGKPVKRGRYDKSTSLKDKGECRFSLRVVMVSFEALF